MSAEGKGAADHLDAEGFQRLTREIAKVGDRDVKAFRDKDRVILVIQNAPEELRKLADALEKASVNEIQAVIAFKQAPPPPKKSDEPPKKG